MAEIPENIEQPDIIFKSLSLSLRFTEQKEAGSAYCVIPSVTNRQTWTELTDQRQVRKQGYTEHVMGNLLFVH